MIKKIPKRVSLSVLITSVLCCLLGTGVVHAQDQQELDREFEFAAGLIDIGFADYAEKVVEQILLRHPDQKDRARLIEAQVLISRRKFDEAKEIVNQMPEGNPKAQAISLALANAYYSINELDKAKNLYQEFFDHFGGRAPTDPDLRRFYMDSAFKFGQMLERAGDYKGAVKAYERVLATDPDPTIKRSLMANQAGLYLRLAEENPNEQEKWIEKTLQICTDLQWGGMDIWFGHSIIYMARAELLRGDKVAAQDVLKDNMDILKEVDKFLKEQGMPLKVSPMAGARFMLGELYEEQGRAFLKKEEYEEALPYLAKSLTEFYNVFAKYGDSDWGPDAGLRAKGLKDTLEAMGKTVKIDLGQYEGKAAETQFRMADNFYSEKHYDQARDEYLKVLNQYPEVTAAPVALGNLAQCYLHTGDDLMVRMVAEYLGERFNGNNQAAMALLGLGKAYFDQDKEDLYMQVYETYLDYFPRHARAPAILFTLAGLQKKKGNIEYSNELFERLIEQYPDDQYYIKALSQIAWDYYLGKQYRKALPALQKYIDATQPGFDRAQAQFCLADAYKQLDQWKNALVSYVKLLKWLSPEESPYDTSIEDARKNDDLEKKATFYIGYCYSRLDKPRESIVQFRDKAIQFYRLYLKKYPDAEMAPKAMNGLGTVLLELGRFDDAVAVFNDLAVKYPDSDEGRNALYSLIRSAMEVEKFGVARDALQKMLGDKQAYSADEFLRVGQLMSNAELYPEAIQAYKIVDAKSDERQHLERALFGQGEALFALQQYAEAAQTMDELMTRYEKSGLFYNAKFIMGKSYRETGQLEKATDALSEVLKYADDPVTINKASYILGQIQQDEGDLEAALASYQRVALLADPANPELRSTVEQCILNSIGVSMELGRYVDTQEICDQYLEVFPEGKKAKEVFEIKKDAKMKATMAATQPAPAPEAAPEPTEE